MARSCGPEMSALAPLLGDNQTSGERVRIDAIDPNVWSGRAVQEVSSIWQYGLASMYPVSPWSSFAPDHHGYQRARDVITGQASTGAIWVTSVRMRWEDRSSIARLILSQTSAGRLHHQ